MPNTPRTSHKFLTRAIAIIAASVSTLLASVAYADYTPVDQNMDQAGQGLNQDLAQIDSSSSGGEAEAEAILIPGTSVSLRAPVGFVASTQFSGLVDSESLASIVLAELPTAAYTELASIFSSTPEAVTNAFAAQGIALEVETISSVLVEGRQVPLVKATQTVGDTQVGKYFALFDGESTVLLTFNVTALASLSEQTIVETIQSVKVAPALSTEQKVAELPFTFEVAAPFQVFDVLLGSTILLSPGGEPNSSREAPVIIIASSVSPVVAADLASFDLSTFADRLLLNTEGFAEASITTRSPIEFAGGEGYLVQASLSDLSVSQYLRILPDSFYIRMLAVGKPRVIENLAPTIDAIQRSIEARP